jgi:membrane protein YdbS with pleckstrin-like domain
LFAVTALTTPTARRTRQVPRRTIHRRPVGNTAARKRSSQAAEAETTIAVATPSVAKPAQINPIPLHQRSDMLWYNKEFDLYQQYPIALRFSIRKSYGWAVLAILSLCSFIWFHGVSGLSEMDETMTRIHFTVFRVAIIALMISIGYWELYRRNFSYRIEGFRLLIERGILFKVYASVPLLPVADILVRRNFADILFGVYNVSLLIPVNAGDHLCTIPGLTRDASFGLREYLAQQLNNQVFIADAALKSAEAPTS